jgi:hypothetical protein
VRVVSPTSASFRSIASPRRATSRLDRRSTFLEAGLFAGRPVMRRVGVDMLSDTPVPNAVQKSIALGRYEDAATALAPLAAERPSLAILVALASVNLQLGDLMPRRRK